MQSKNSKKEQNQLKKQKTIQTKLIGLSILSSFLIVAIFVSLFYFLIIAQKETTTKKELTQYTTQVASVLENKMDRYKEILNVSSKSSLFYNFFSTRLISTIHTHLKSYVESYPEIKYFYFGTKTEEMYIWPYVEMKKDYNPRQTEWYRSAEESKKTSVSSVYLDSTTKAPVVTISEPVYDEKQTLVGVIGIDIRLENLINIVQESKTGIYTKLLLVDDKNEPIEMTKTEESKLLLQNEAIQSLLRQPQGSIEKLDNHYATLAPIKGYHYRLLVLASTDKIYAETIQSSLIVALVGFILIVLSTLVFLVTSKKAIQQPIENLKNAFRFDLNGKIKLSRVDCKTKDEIGELSSVLNTFSDQVREFVQSTTKTSKEILDLSNEIDSNMQSNLQNTEEIVSSVENLVGISQNQAEFAEKGMAFLTNFDYDLESSVISASQLTETSEQLEKGLEELMETFQQFAKLSEQSSKVAQLISETRGNADKKATEEGKKIVKKISYQINQLSIEASIEAARAGEAGKGFATVADKARKLAEESETAFAEINARTNAFICTTENTATQMAEIDTIVQQQAEKAEEVYRVSLQLAEKAKNIKKDVAMITRLLSQQNHSKTEGLNSLENIIRLAQEVTANSQEVSTRIQEQKEWIRTFAEKSQNGKDFVKELKENLNKFIV